MTEKRFETEVIHSGYKSDEFRGSLAPPLFQTSTFTFETAEQGARRFAGEEDGFIYSRLGNPTVAMLEERMAAIEKGEKALAFASGMAAVSAILISLTRSGDHILCSQGVYGCTFGLLQLMQDHDFSMMSTREEVLAAIKPETACIYIETPINPTMRLVDLEMVAEVAREKGIPVVVIILSVLRIYKIQSSWAVILSFTAQRNTFAVTEMSLPVSQLGQRKSCPRSR